MNTDYSPAVCITATSPLRAFPHYHQMSFLLDFDPFTGSLALFVTSLLVLTKGGGEIRRPIWIPTIRVHSFPDPTEWRWYKYPFYQRWTLSVETAFVENDIMWPRRNSTGRQLRVGQAVCPLLVLFASNAAPDMLRIWIWQQCYILPPDLELATSHEGGVIKGQPNYRLLITELCSSSSLLGPYTLPGTPCPQTPQDFSTYHNLSIIVNNNNRYKDKGVLVLN